VRTEMDAEARVHGALGGVMDPEIPACSIVDLGMIERVGVDDDAVEVDLLPTFVGCPAKDIIGEDVRSALAEVAGGREIRVRFVLDPPWTTDRITERGEERLRSFGISPQWRGGPPTRSDGPTPVPLLRRVGVPCPYCGSERTVMDSAWGSTPCRTTHYCEACRNPFVGFKTKAAAAGVDKTAPSR
jgi:ring-1,2-phenylacetyl-CoA epoxidase subunit PaaD